MKGNVGNKEGCGISLVNTGLDNIVIRRVLVFLGNGVEVFLCVFESIVRITSEMC